MHVDKKDAERGLYEKFTVTRTDGRSAPGEKHDGCEYFVLDLTHDPYAKPALAAYADACADSFPALARDLRALLASEEATILERGLADAVNKALDRFAPQSEPKTEPCRDCAVLRSRLQEASIQLTEARRREEAAERLLLAKPRGHDERDLLAPIDKALADGAPGPSEEVERGE